MPVPISAGDRRPLEFPARIQFRQPSIDVGKMEKIKLLYARNLITRKTGQQDLSFLMLVENVYE